MMILKSAPFARKGMALFNGRFIIAGIDCFPILTPGNFTQGLLEIIHEKTLLPEMYLEEKDIKKLNQRLPKDFKKLKYREDAWYVHEILHQKHFAGTFFESFFYGYSIAFRILVMHSLIIEYTRNVIPYEQIEKILLLQAKLRLFFDLIIETSEQLTCGFEMYWGTMSKDEIQKNYGDNVLNGAGLVCDALKNGASTENCVNVFRDTLNEYQYDILKIINNLDGLPYKFDDEDRADFMKEKASFHEEFRKNLEKIFKHEKKFSDKEIEIPSAISNGIGYLIANLPSSSLAFFIQHYLVSDFCFKNLIEPFLSKSRFGRLLFRFLNHKQEQKSIEEQYQKLILPIIILSSHSAIHPIKIKETIYIETATVQAKEQEKNRKRIVAIDSPLIREFESFPLVSDDHTFKIFFKLFSLCTLCSSSVQNNFIENEINEQSIYAWGGKNIINNATTSCLNSCICDSVMHFQKSTDNKTKLKHVYNKFQQFRKHIREEKKTDKQQFILWTNLFRYLHSHGV